MIGKLKPVLYDATGRKGRYRYSYMRNSVVWSNIISKAISKCQKFSGGACPQIPGFRWGLRDYKVFAWKNNCWKEDSEEFFRTVNNGHFASFNKSLVYLGSCLGVRRAMALIGKAMGKSGLVETGLTGPAAMALILQIDSAKWTHPLQEEQGLAASTLAWCHLHILCII